MSVELSIGSICLCDNVGSLLLLGIIHIYLLTSSLLDPAFTWSAAQKLDSSVANIWLIAYQIASVLAYEQERASVTPFLLDFNCAQFQRVLFALVWNVVT